MGFHYNIKSHYFNTLDDSRSITQNTQGLMNNQMSAIKLSSQKKPRGGDKKRKEPITYYELVELENQRNNPPPPKVKLIRKFPIAPDGFVPNSVVQKFFEMFEPDEQVAPAPIIWRLNWVS